ncbi:low affinity immunoglobulin gamma Fc region receptor II-c-like isoform X2 [Gymnodraco acuticeps]|uniref:low affinity immunoglobulin gamma Fc region receptor II-c-like isoform X2 n=1 Tax=Gymnodraco acuticeps TaxID=8218 RepID=UPI001471BB11|nr:low affinity immunoglobulin gamma Fc region receptor II-c-like isoform X2 [Gymnodraco acuticeps]
MEATALCITLWMTVFLQLCEQKVDADVWIEPSRLQVFEYEPFSLRCVGFDGLTDVNISRRNKAGKETCDGSKWGSLNETNCTITSPYKEDSGDYWCETRGKKSDYVNVIITAGSVILESPVLPVMEGESVTLSCRNKTTTSSILSADFYKDGRLIRSSSTGNITIHRVSKSDEGLYKCSISEGGESPESRLAVRAGSVILESPVLPVMEGESVTLSCRKKTITSSILSADFYKDGRLIRRSSTGNITIQRVSKSDEGLYKCSISEGGESPESWLAVRVSAKETSSTLSPWIFVSVSSMLLLLAVGIHRFYRSYRHRVSVEASAVDSGQMLYAVVSKTRKKKGVDQSYPTPVYYTLGPGETQQQEPSVTEDALYSTIQPLKMEI